MKTCALYGFISALAGAFLILIMYFLGLHSDISKLGTANTIGNTCALVIGVTCTVLGVRARRAEVPAGEGFGYGSALWAGILVTFFASLLSAIFNYAYNDFINPGLSEILVQDSINKLEARGISGDRLEKMESFYRSLFTPGWECVIAFVVGMIFGLIISLIVAAILKRPAPAQVRAQA
jgi:hypothetical protein